MQVQVSTIDDSCELSSIAHVPGEGASSQSGTSAGPSALSFAPSFASSSSTLQEPAGNAVAQAVNKTRLSLHRLSTDSPQTQQSP